jgi:general secretion pathway protein M
VLMLNRAQTMAVGSLGLLLLICGFAVSVSLEIRADAAQDLSERRAVLSQLEARGSRTTAIGRPVGGTAPPAAYLDASTQGLAAAQLQSYFSRLAVVQQAVVVSSGVEPDNREDGAGSIRIQTTIETTLGALQALLYQLESGTPYVFVDSLAVLTTPGATRGVQASPLRTTLKLRALWQRRAP